MRTITAIDLRNNLDDIVKRVRRGESIRVTYRSKPAFLLQPDMACETSAEPGSLAAMKEYVARVQKLNATPRQSTLDPSRPVKDLYHELLDTDPKYQS